MTIQNDSTTSKHMSPTMFELPGDSIDFCRKFPFAVQHVKHLRDVSMTFDGKKEMLIRRDRELAEKAGDITKLYGFRSREIQKHGTPVTVQENSRQAPVDWRAEFEGPLAEIKAERALIEAQLRACPPSLIVEVEEFCRRNLARKWAEVPLPDLRLDPRLPGEIAEQADDALADLLSQRDHIRTADLPLAEVEQKIRAAVNGVKGRASFNWPSLFVGGRVRNGVYHPTNEQAFEFPQLYSAVDITTGDKQPAAGTLVHDDYAAVLFNVFGDRIVDYLVEQARKFAGTKPAISSAEKVEQLADIEQQIEQAWRDLEGAIRHAESNGLVMKRRTNTPVPVLLWITRA